MDDVFGFLLAGLALAGSPGPATLSLAATGAAFGRRGGLGYLAGNVAGMVMVMILTASGVVALILAVPGASLVLTVIAALYFAYLALRIALALPLGETTADARRPDFLAGVILSLVNPKGYVAMAALFSGFALIPDQMVLDTALKITLLTAVIIAVNTVWLLAGGLLTPAFQHPSLSRLVNVIFAALLLGSVAAAFFL